MPPRLRPASPRSELSPLLPFCEDDDDDGEKMMLQDARDVFDCLNRLMFQEYQDWKDGLYHQAWSEACTCPDDDSDHDGWEQREIEHHYAELLNVLEN